MSRLALWIAICLALAGCGTPVSDPSLDFGVLESLHKEDDRPPSELRAFIDSFDVDQYVKDHRLAEVAADFPIRAGMSLAEADEALRANERFADTHFPDAYNFGWETRRITGGSGWVYYWVNGKALLHTNLCVKHNRLESVWVMPGNRAFATGVYYRLSGQGSRLGTNGLFDEGHVRVRGARE